MIAISLDVPASDVATIGETFKRYVAYYNGNVKKTVEKTCVQIIKSLAGSTKKSATLRPIVRNPDPKAKTDARMAVFGVYKFRGNREKYFSPIRGTGEYGKIRYTDKKTLKVMEWDKNTGKRAPVILSNADVVLWGGFDKLLKNHPKRKIKRSGMAKSSWGWMLAKLGKTAAVNIPEVTGAVTVDKFGDPDNFFGVEMTDKLRYIKASLRGGQPISSILQRASNQMRVDMGEIPKKAKKAAGFA